VVEFAIISRAVARSQNPGGGGLDYCKWERYIPVALLTPGKLKTKNPKC